MIHKYEVVKEGVHHTLYKDGVQSFCPKLNPFPVQGDFNNINWQRFPCNTGCPFANIEEIENKEGYWKPHYTIKCEGNTISHELVALKKNRNESESPIIQL